MNFLQGEHTTFYTSFVDSISAPVVEGISGTIIDIYHFSPSDVFIQDIISGTMTKQGGLFSSIWYYNYNIPINADMTSYNVVYTAMFSGAIIQTIENYNVLPVASAFPSPFGVGSVATSGTVVNTSGVGIFAASVSIASGVNISASATTDISGNYIAYLNPGTYLFSFFANGYYPTQTLQSIPSGTMWNAGIQVLQSASQGTLVISDTFAYQTPNKTIYYLENLKVTLNAELDNANAPPYGVAYTNPSGTFVMNASPGLYVMSVQGEYWNQNTQKNDRYNYSYNIEVDAVWSGSGANGTSSPINFQYLDTSKYNFL